MKKALITGITGQDGQYLASLLSGKGYEVHGMGRRVSNGGPELPKETIMHDGDLLNTTVVDEIIRDIAPDEIYNLAAQSHVGTSFKLPEYTAEVTGLGVLRILEAMRRHVPTARLYQASTSEMFGNEPAPQNEKTPFMPRSPYGVSKLFAHQMVKNYRESYKLHASCGILFNHESPLRGKDFVTRKITLGLANVYLGRQECVELGNLDSVRDWGFARDYVRAMWLMLQQDIPDDYVIATGEAHTVREFVERSCDFFGFVVKWSGEGPNEIGTDKRTGRVIIRVNPKFYRPAEVNFLLGDSSKARKSLGWEPFTKFESLVWDMCRADIDRLEK